MESANKGVSVILCTAHPGTLDEAFGNFFRQTYPEKELIVIVNNNQLDLKQYQQRAQGHDQIEVHQLDEQVTLGECFEFGFQRAKYDYIAKFDDDDYYSSEYLAQAMSELASRECGVVGKASYFIYFKETQRLTLCRESKENSYVWHLADGTLVFKRHVLEQLKIPRLPREGTFTQMQDQVNQLGYRMYSTDRFHYAIQRNPDPQKHTWQVTEEEFLNNPTIEVIEEQVGDIRPYVESQLE